MVVAQEFSWWNVVPTLIGGGISLVTTVIMFWVNRKVDQNKRDTEKRKNEALNAFVAFWKLKAVTEYILNTDSHINEAFKSVGNEVMTREPSDVVTGFLSADQVFPTFTITELVFLHRQKRTQIIADIELLLARARNVEATIKKYTELRQNLEVALELKATDIVEVDVDRATVTLSSKDASLINLRRANLNRLLAELFQLLERDVPLSKQLTEDFLEVARLEFASDFPDFKLEWVK